jgi:hypothetical protein
MIPPLYRFPESARYGRVLPKSAIYQHAKPSPALRKKFVEQIGQIQWQYKLSPDTINLPPRGAVQEIDVLDVELKTPELDEDVLRCIDRAIPRPVLFRLRHEQRLRMIAAYKRPSEADTGRWVTDGYFADPWLAAGAEHQPLPVALDMQGLYEQLLRSLLPVSARPGESLPEQVARIDRLRTLQRRHQKLEGRLRREAQFNRKVELNAELRTLKNEIDRLAPESGW